MSVYDLAHSLAAELKKSPEYLDYIRLKELAEQSDTQKALLDEYKKLQFQLQISMAGGGSPNPSEMERLQKISAVLQMSPEAGQYMLAEFRFQRLLADIYKILGEAAGVDMDLLTGN
ncbi:MAG: YlbF family regulator [Christensenellaceae bacterium]|jgi:cell fate (sporulation/competence/biofilm development) regulator YlbF (YheA/YmcA/DUF963 family)|nr:YlbF family regulator [Christensenellaceae bacterium]